MRSLWAALAVALAVGSSAPVEVQARMHAPYRGHRIYSPAAPLDSFATPAAAYSLRRLKSSYAGPGIRLRRASDSLEADINFLSFTGFTGAPIDVAAAGAHCAATSCTVVTWYDQSGNARHATNATPASQPAYTASCNGTLPCAQTTGSQLLLSSSAALTAGGKGSYSVVANRSAGTGNCFWLASNGINSFRAVGTIANMWALEDGVTNILPAPADNAWHAASGVINGASSVVRIDGIETTGNIAGNAAAGQIYLLFGSASTTCSETEAVYWDGYYLSAAERAGLRANQQSFWGTP